MQSRSLVRLIFSNLGWLVASFGLAMVIWVGAKMQKNPIEQRNLTNIPFEIELPEGFVITRQPDLTTVAITVRTDQEEWGRIEASDFQIIADLTDISAPGEYRIELEARPVTSLHADIVDVTPGMVTFAVDRHGEARVAVRVIVTEDPPLGYTYPPDLTCAVTEVLVSGSVERVATVQQVEARLNLSDDLNPTTKTVNLIPVSADGTRVRDVVLEPASVTCPVDVQPREDITPVEVLPDRGNTNPPPGYIFEGYADLQPRTVGVTGDQDAIAAMNRVVKTVPIDLSNVTSTFTAEVPLALPPGVSLVDEDLVVRVTVLISPVLGNREFQDVPVRVTGLDPEEFRATGLAATVTVNVAGPQVELDNLTVSNLLVEVNLAGLAAGNHQVRPTATIIDHTAPGHFTINSILPEQLSVTIEALKPTPTPAPSPTRAPG